MLRLLMLSFLLACCSSGARVAQVRMPQGSDSTDLGELTLVFSQEAHHVVVAINGALVVDGVTSKKLHIRGVESGYANVSIAADGIERSARIWIEAGQATAVPIGNAGEPRSRNPLLMTALSVMAFLISRAATDYLF